MEVRKIIPSIINDLLMPILVVLIFVTTSHAQTAGKTDFKDGAFLIELNKNAGSDALEKFIINYDLKELNLKEVLRTNQLDTLYKLGWKVVTNTAQKLVITKGLLGSSNVKDPANEIFNTQHPKFKALFPVVSDNVEYGYNNFNNKKQFQVNKDVVRFYMRNYKQAETVMLAGSFNNWLPTALQMKKTDSGWIADVKLGPGKYWYKFIIDGRWTTDPDNQLKENDGLGNTNSVYYQPNYEFQLAGFENARNVYVSGSFNDWKEKELKMQRVAGKWQLPLYLADGTHRYKFLVDGKWITDPSNNEKLGDGRGGFNSVLKLGVPTRFALQGFKNASEVILSGDFNFWRTDELPMHKTPNGWELNYYLAPGNYEYKFIVDGNWITDPANPNTIENDAQTKNSYLIVGANYTFKINGLAKAKKVYLAGDFNNWSPTSLPMTRVGDEWICKVHLSPGKHKYKLVVDGEWIRDPGNKQWEQNEFGTGNSVVWFEGVL